MDFTNKELGLQDIAIGVNEGIPVKIIGFDQAIEEIEKGNICIILREDSEAFKELESLKQTNIRKNGIIVLSPVLAKGQEFTKVIVFDKNMDSIDKYISYTRAKVELLVCDDA